MRAEKPSPNTWNSGVQSSALTIAAARRSGNFAPPIFMAHAIRQREYKHHAERHVAAGANLRDVMLGLNDGLVASFAVTSGVAGAFSNPSVVLMAGLAEMLGGAVSMGLAAFISARSQIEFYESEVDRERYEIKRFPEHERDEIRGIYKQK